jgi:hypothetical protein
MQNKTQKESNEGLNHERSTENHEGEIHHPKCCHFHIPEIILRCATPIVLMPRESIGHGFLRRGLSGILPLGNQPSQNAFPFFFLNQELLACLDGRVSSELLQASGENGIINSTVFLSGQSLFECVVR